ncbi:hypothetical protein [Aliarcobacter vitoriensis]|uniref:Uncharacterized protein n=1 Tax=Aliarcobacter vitoriensis TaxID=2011099 RepID=A0A366MU82_9BACT|nr:hypothetical protein [Aliarcobacter vitoriensis]RBQ29617.1 hypothetical protein CRU91_03185 [Aliarcobacter vitoriensis]
MALPFILGLAVGVGAIIAYKNSDKLKANSKKLFEYAKDSSKELQEKVVTVKEKLEEKLQQKPEKKEIKKEEVKPKRKYTRKQKEVK